MHKCAKLGFVAAALAIPVMAGCSKSNTTGTGSSSIPLPSSVPGPVSIPGPSTTVTGGPKPGRPASCDAGDLFGYALLDASYEGPTATPAEKAAIADKLEKATTTLKAALPEYATEIDYMAQSAKLTMEGKPSDTAAPGNKYDAWYKSTCITS